MRTQELINHIANRCHDYMNGEPAQQQDAVLTTSKAVETFLSDKGLATASPDYERKVFCMAQKMRMRLGLDETSPQAQQFLSACFPELAASMVRPQAALLPSPPIAEGGVRRMDEVVFSAGHGGPRFTVSRQELSDNPCFLQAMCSERFSERPDRTGAYVVSDITPSQLQGVVGFIKTGRVPGLTKDNADDLFEIADYFGPVAMRAFIEEFKRTAETELLDMSLFSKASRQLFELFKAEISLALADDSQASTVVLRHPILCCVEFSRHDGAPDNQPLEALSGHFVEWRGHEFRFEDLVVAWEQTKLWILAMGHGRATISVNLKPMCSASNVARSYTVAFSQRAS